MLNGYLGAKHLDYTPLSALRSTTLGDPFFGKKKKPLSLFTRCAARVLSHFFRVGGSKSFFLSNNKSASCGVFKSIVPHEEAGPVSKTSALCEAEKKAKVQNAPPFFSTLLKP